MRGVQALAQGGAPLVLVGEYPHNTRRSTGVADRSDAEQSQLLCRWLFISGHS